jgi:hypothetical protein
LAPQHDIHNTAATQKLRKGNQLAAARIDSRITCSRKSSLDRIYRVVETSAQLDCLWLSMPCRRNAENQMNWHGNSQ